MTQAEIIRAWATDTGIGRAESRAAAESLNKTADGYRFVGVHPHCVIIPECDLHTAVRLVQLFCLPDWILPTATHYDGNRKVLALYCGADLVDDPIQFMRQTQEKVRQYLDDPKAH